MNRHHTSVYHINVPFSFSFFLIIRFHLTICYYEVHRHSSIFGHFTMVLLKQDTSLKLLHFTMATLAQNTLCWSIIKLYTFWKVQLHSFATYHTIVGLEHVGCGVEMKPWKFLQGLIFCVSNWLLRMRPCRECCIVILKCIQRMLLHFHALL